MDTTSQQQEFSPHSASVERLFPASDALDRSDHGNHHGDRLDRVRGTLGQTRTKGGLAAWQIQRIARFIRESLHTKLMTRVLASQVYLSEFHFCRAFRSSFGESPHVYVTRCRVEAAKKLLSTTTMPIGDIALECGAADQAHFTNLFRRCAGQTPGAWRRLRRGGGHDNSGSLSAETLSELAL